MSDIRKRTGAKGTTYQVRYADPGAASGYAYKTFETRKEALAFRETAKPVTSPSAHSAGIVTVADGMQKWLAAKIPRWADDFPYVNGGLFSGSMDVPRFSRIARSYLLHVGGLDWTKINPDIFGSMIQAVAEDEERGELGMHYTVSVRPRPC